MHDDQIDSLRYVFLSQEQYDSIFNKSEEDNLNKELKNENKEENIKNE